MSLTTPSTMRCTINAKTKTLMLYENGRRIPESEFRQRNPLFDYTSCRTIKQRLNEMSTIGAKLSKKANTIEACKATIENVQHCERVVEQVKKRLVDTTANYEARLKKLSMSIQTPRTEDCAQLKKQLETVQQELNNTRKAIKDLEHARNNQQSVADIKKLTDLNEALARRNKENETSLTALNEALDKKNKENEIGLTALKEALAKKNEESAQNNALLTEKNRLEGIVAKMRDDASQKTTALTQLAESTFTTNPLFQAPISGNQELESKLVSIQAELDAKKLELERLSVAGSPNNTLSSRVAELDAALNKNSNEMIDFVTRTQGQIERLTAENEKYRAELATKESKLRETDEILTMIRSSLEETGIEGMTIQDMVGELVTHYKRLQEAFTISEEQLRRLQENPDARLERAKTLATKWLQRLRTEYTAYIKALPKEANKVILDMKKTNWQARKEFEQIESLIGGAAIDLSVGDYDKNIEKPEVEIIEFFKEKLGICINQPNKPDSNFINMVFSRLYEAKQEISREWQGVIENPYIINMGVMIDKLQDKIARAFSNQNFTWKSYNQESWTKINDSVSTFFKKIINEFDFDLLQYNDINWIVDWIDTNFPQVNEHINRGLFGSTVNIDSIEDEDEFADAEEYTPNEEEKLEPEESPEREYRKALVNSLSDEVVPVEVPVEVPVVVPVEVPVEAPEQTSFNKVLAELIEDDSKEKVYIETLYKKLKPFLTSNKSIKEVTTKLFTNIKTAISYTPRGKQQQYYKNLYSVNWQTIIEEIKRILAAISKNLDVNSVKEISTFNNGTAKSLEVFNLGFRPRRPTKPSRKRRSIRKHR